MRYWRLPFQGSMNPWTIQINRKSTDLNSSHPTFSRTMRTLKVTFVRRHSLAHNWVVQYQSTPIGPNPIIRCNKKMTSGANECSKKLGPSIERCSTLFIAFVYIAHWHSVSVITFLHVHEPPCRNRLDAHNFPGSSAMIVLRAQHFVG